MFIARGKKQTRRGRATHRGLKQTSLATSEKTPLVKGKLSPHPIRAGLRASFELTFPFRPVANHRPAAPSDCILRRVPTWANCQTHMTFRDLQKCGVNPNNGPGCITVVLIAK